jgi:TP901 family phage tail tape measure protein
VTGEVHVAGFDVDIVLRLVDQVTGAARRISGSLREVENAAGGRGAGRGGAVPGIVGVTTQTRALGGAASVATGIIAGMAAQVAAAATAFYGWKGSFGAAMSIESAMTEVQKKVSGTAEDYARLRTELINLSRETPLSAVELMNLAAEAGGAGIEMKDLSKFAMLASKAAVAFDMDARKTGDSLGTLKNAFKLSIPQVEDLADAINFAADSGAAKEPEIITFLQRMAGFGSAMKIAPKDLVAVGSAMMDVGISSHVAATSVQSVMSALGKASEVKKAQPFFKQMGLSGKAIEKAFAKDSVQTLLLLLEKSKSLKSEDQFKFFNALFGVMRQDEAFAIQQNIDKIRERIAALRNEQQYAGSVQKTYALQTATTAARLTTLGNNLTALGAMVADPILQKVNPWLADLNSKLSTIEKRDNVFAGLESAMSSFIRTLSAGGGPDGAGPSVLDSLFGDIDPARRARTVNSYAQWGREIAESIPIQAIRATFSELKEIFTSTAEYLGTPPSIAGWVGGFVALWSTFRLTKLAASGALAAIKALGTYLLTNVGAIGGAVVGWAAAFGRLAWALKGLSIPAGLLSLLAWSVTNSKNDAAGRDPIKEHHQKIQEAEKRAKMERDSSGKDFTFGGAGIGFGTGDKSRSDIRGFQPWGGLGDRRLRNQLGGLPSASEAPPLGRPTLGSGLFDPTPTADSGPKEVTITNQPLQVTNLNPPSINLSISVSAPITAQASPEQVQSAVAAGVARGAAEAKRAIESALHDGGSSIG